MKITELWNEKSAQKQSIHILIYWSMIINKQINIRIVRFESLLH